MIVRENKRVIGSVSVTSTLIGKTNVGAVFDGEGASVPEYKGEYSVTPSQNEQTLLTANKRMSKNVTVKEIPYAEVSNVSGGLTVTIGGE